VVTIGRKPPPVALVVAVAALIAYAKLPAAPARPPEYPKSTDPLFPRDPSDISTGLVACAQCHNHKLPIDPKTNIWA
jgi:hypothetical protein